MYDNFDNLFKLTSEYVEKATEVAGDAFHDDPLTLFVYPDEKERRRKLKYGFYMIYKYGIKNGVVYATSNNLEGIIVWLPPNKIFPSMWTMMRHGGFRAMRKVGLKIKAMKRSMTVFNYEESKHRELAPFDHWYLQNIAVKPAEQSKGYGGQLISAMIEIIDLEGLPIYLETNNEKNFSFYQKYEFEILEHGIVPETEVPFWCLLRKPS
ncbi:MAG: GNAT family N-acetyltransferase [Candidatus Lokiarchaeota archaeon]|nr:GNAT family N-acetyltransferase [Candidatus Lokiarchaeota archaeon]